MNIASTAHGKSSKGGWNAAIFIILVEVAQQFAFYGLASNLIMYLTNVLDQPLAAAAKNVTTWLGVSSVFPVLGAFLADSYFGRFKTIVFSVAIYFLGTVLLTLSVSVIPSQRRRAVFFVALYILSVAQGGQQPCLQTFAADQFDENTPEEIKAKSSFFNWWYLGFVFAATSATLGVVYLQDNVGWGLGFGIMAGVLVVSLVSFLLGTKRYRKQRPPGSPFTTVAQVLVAAARKWHVTETLNCENVYYGDEKGEGQLQGQSQPVVLARTNQLRCLDKAMIIDELDASTEPRNPWRLCSLNQVEEVKLVLRLIPLWLSCLMFGVIQVQHNTFFTKQSSTTILSIGPHFQVPPASLQGLTGIVILITIPIYDRVFVPIARKYTGHPSGITVLQRIGTGLVLSILVMVVSALVEAKRLNIAKDYNLIDKPKAIVPMRVWWLLPQYLILGLAYAFATVGLQELFYHQMPEQMRSMGAAALNCVMGVGSFMSNWIISVVQLITSRNGDKWLGDNINRAHLDYFYWVLAVLGTLNFCVYVLVANFFVYKKVEREDKVKTELSIANNHGGEIRDILIGHDSSAQEEQDSNMDKVIYH